MIFYVVLGLQVNKLRTEDSISVLGSIISTNDKFLINGLYAYFLRIDKRKKKTSRKSVLIARSFDLTRSWVSRCWKGPAFQGNHNWQVKRQRNGRKCNKPTLKMYKLKTILFFKQYFHLFPNKRRLNNRWCCKSFRLCRTMTLGQTRNDVTSKTKYVKMHERRSAFFPLPLPRPDFFFFFFFQKRFKSKTF